MNDVKKQCNLYNLTANLFYTLGDFKNAEMAYVLYVKLIEDTFGNNS